MRPATLCLLACFALLPNSARAGALRIALENGAQHLTPPSAPTSWGLSTGISMRVGVGALGGIQLHGAWPPSPLDGAGRRTYTLGATLVYLIDRARVTPFVEAGYLSLYTRPDVPSASEPRGWRHGFLLGGGVDIRWENWFAGPVLRYASVFGGSPLEEPGHTQLVARVGYTWLGRW